MTTVAEKKKAKNKAKSIPVQVHVISLLFEYLLKTLSADYRVYTNEVGIQFREKSWRAADIAVYEKDQLKTITLEKLLEQQ